MELKSNPLASVGPDGITTRNPGVWQKYASGDWEWYSPPCPTAPALNEQAIRGVEAHKQENM